MASLALIRNLQKVSLCRNIPSLVQVSHMSGEYGSGAGKGGGGGGSIRDAGGAFGKMEAAREEQYFRKLQAVQIEHLKEHLDQEISHHEHEIKRHQEAIQRHKKRIDKLHHDKWYK